MNDLYKTGVRPLVDKYLLEKATEKRDYGKYWSASQAGYCMKKVIFDRLQLPNVSEDARKQRVFEAGHIFHEWIQRITKDSGLSIEQELELEDDYLMTRGHIDDLIVTGDNRMILQDYKTQNSRAFTYQKDRPMSHYHRMQLGTYLYMLRKKAYPTLDEARIIKISKDDLRMSEQQLAWDSDIEKDVIDYWTTINEHWANKTLPRCTCGERENGFMASNKYNPYFYNGGPCSTDWLEECVNQGTVDKALALWYN